MRARGYARKAGLRCTNAGARLRTFNRCGLAAFALLACSTVWGGTFFVFVEESLDQEYLETVSPVSEALLAGLFDRGHIVFDDNGMEPGFPWDAEGLARLLATGRNGGAEYFVAVRVDTVSRKREAPDGEPPLTCYDTSLRFYCYRVAGGLLLESGEMTESNGGRELELSRIDLGTLLGERLSARVEAACIGPARPELAAERGRTSP